MRKLVIPNGVRNLLAITAFCAFSGAVVIAGATLITSCLKAPAQTPTPACTTERFYDGLKETPDYLQLATEACVITVPAQVSYALKFDHTVQAADLQMGSNTGSELEWAFWVDFLLPSGQSFSLFNQYDKHQDVSGNRHEWRTFPVPLHLPAGTQVTIRRPALPAAYCTKPGPYGSEGVQACATGQKIELVGVIP